MDGYTNSIYKKYHDKFNWSIMMDPESTKVRNEIMRRIKLYQIKERKLPNFIRVRRKEMLNEREKHMAEMSKVGSSLSGAIAQSHMPTT